MGEALRLLRIFNGYKSAELAKKLELSQSYVSELENGKKQPTMEVLDKYAKVFEMKKSTLMLFAESLEGEEIKNDEVGIQRMLQNFSGLLTEEQIRENMKKYNLPKMFELCMYDLESERCPQIRV